jgi:hypothetical protein
MNDQSRAHNPALFAQHEVNNAQAFISNEVDAARLALHNEVGFVVQHRCTAGDIVYVCSWRDNNQVWETIYSKGLESGSLLAVTKRATKTATFCVWVIPVVAHEQQAWVKYLRSAHDDRAKHDYFMNQFSGYVG